MMAHEGGVRWVPRFSCWSQLGLITKHLCTLFQTTETNAKHDSIAQKLLHLLLFKPLKNKSGRTPNQRSRGNMGGICYVVSEMKEKRSYWWCVKYLDWLLLIQMRSAPLKMTSLRLTWSTDLVSKNKRHYKDDKAIFKGKVLFEDW